MTDQQSTEATHTEDEPAVGMAAPEDDEDHIVRSVN